MTFESVVSRKSALPVIARSDVDLAAVQALARVHGAALPGLILGTIILTTLSPKYKFSIQFTNASMNERTYKVLFSLFVSSFDNLML